MNQKAIYRSIWEEGTVETNCEITPRGEIINVETAEPQFDAETLLSEEVSLCMADVTLEVVSNSDGEPHAKDFHPLLRYLVLNITNVPFPDGNQFGGFAIYDALLDSWVADPANCSQPYVCNGGVNEGQQLAIDEDLSSWKRVHNSLGITKSQNDPIQITLPVFDISIEITPDRCSGAISSSLKDGDTEYDAAMDAIESIILAHAIAGIDVSGQAYIQGIETAVQACANNLGADDTDEDSDEHMNQWYSSNSGVRCPVCKSDTLEGGGVEVNGGTATQDVSCLTCGSCWDDQYQLTGFSNLQRGEDHKSICQSGNCGLDLTEPFSVVREYTDKDGGPSLHIEGHYDEEKTFTPDVTPTFGGKRFDLLDDSDRCANCKFLV